MIGRLTGSLLEKNPPQILLDVQGVGYELSVPMSTFYNLPALHERVVLYTQLIVREDAHLLYGFASEGERAAFRHLLKISGVGPKMALSVLSGLSLSDLASAVSSKEVARLIRIPGVGKKTAERLLLELQGTLQFHRGTTLPTHSWRSVTAGKRLIGRSSSCPRASTWRTAFVRHLSYYLRHDSKR